jgi:hypothetical protein
LLGVNQTAIVFVQNNIFCPMKRVFYLSVITNHLCETPCAQDFTRNVKRYCVKLFAVTNTASAYRNIGNRSVPPADLTDNTASSGVIRGGTERLQCYPCFVTIALIYIVFFISNAIIAFGLCKCLPGSSANYFILLLIRVIGGNVISIFLFSCFLVFYV